MSQAEVLRKQDASARQLRLHEEIYMQSIVILASFAVLVGIAAAAESVSPLSVEGIHLGMKRGEAIRLALAAGYLHVESPSVEGWQFARKRSTRLGDRDLLVFAYVQGNPARNVSNRVFALQSISPA